MSSAIAAALAVFSIIFGAAFIDAPFAAGHWFVLCGGFAAAFLAGVVARPYIRAQRGVPSREISGQGALVSDYLQDGIEMLGDLKWELHENEVRYRDLLDNQNDVILHRDLSGRLVFANDAFCAVFGIARESIVGRRFDPEVIDGEGMVQNGETLLHGKRRYVQRLQTSLGERWYLWEDFVLRGDDLAATGLQSVGRDITEQRQAEMALQEARDLAEAASGAKSRFLASVSHEIRTPMNGILGMTGLLFDTKLTAEQLTYVRAVNQSAKTLLSLIDEILDFSKIEAGKFDLEESSFDFAAMVQAVAELMSPRAYDKSLELGWYVDRQIPTALIGDEARLRQILLNLVGNAIKFTDHGGVSIEVSTTSQFAELPTRSSDIDSLDKIGVRIEVRDTGVGMSESDLGTIFGEFEQADNRSSRRFGGTGLGLAISKRLVEQMGGDIAVSSVLGQGSVFVVEIPFNVDGANVAAQHIETPLRQRRCLIVSDMEIENELMAKTLQASGQFAAVSSFDCATVSIWNAADKDQHFDAVIVDGNRGCQAAGDVLLQARQAANENVAGIVLIHASDRNSIGAFREVGFESYLVRPIRPTSLLVRLTSAAMNSAFASEAEKDDCQAPFQHFLTTDNPGQVEVRESIRVLVAEDNDINALLAQKMLQSFGCEVVRVDNGREAVDAVAHSFVRCENGAIGRPFDVVLMDVQMPVMDGIQATQALLKMGDDLAPSGRVIPPIIALTANALAEDKARCIEAGLSDYLSKPFEKEQLEELLSKWTVYDRLRVNGEAVVADSAKLCRH